MENRWAPARYTAAPGAQHYGLHDVYHPVVRAIAPPGCEGAWLRAPLGLALQLAVDVTCGVAAAACALGALLLGHRAFAAELLREHKLQLAFAFAAIVQGAGISLAAGIAFCIFS